MLRRSRLKEMEDLTSSESPHKVSVESIPGCTSFRPVGRGDLIVQLARASKVEQGSFSAVSPPLWNTQPCNLQHCSFVCLCPYSVKLENHCVRWRFCVATIGTALMTFSRIGSTQIWDYSYNYNVKLSGKGGSLVRTESLMNDGQETNRRISLALLL